jgi:hypothetical protein
MELVLVAVGAVWAWVLASKAGRLDGAERARALAGSYMMNAAAYSLSLTRFEQQGYPEYVFLSLLVIAFCLAMGVTQYGRSLRSDDEPE